MLEDQWKTYIAKACLRPSRVFWIPHTKIGVHWSELDPQVIERYKDLLYGEIERIVRDLKMTKCIDLGSSQDQLNLYEFLQSWRDSIELGGELISSRPIEMMNIDPELLYALIYHEIFCGKRTKRSFRIHTCEMIDFVIKHNGTLKELNLMMTSISPEGMLFFITKEQKRLLTDSESMEVKICPHFLFSTSNEKLRHDLRGFDPIFNEPQMLEAHRFGSCFGVDLSLVKFHISHMEFLKSGSKQGHYFCIPFRALKDITLNDQAYVGECLQEKLEMLGKDINDLALMG